MSSRENHSKKSSVSSRQSVSRSENVPKVLRIGILQGGKIVEERIVRKRENVSVGQSEKNNFIVVSDELPSRFDMFEVKDGKYFLQFTQRMNGRFSIQGELKELKDLRNGAAKKKGKFSLFPLDDSARGKIVLGDTAILFQFVMPPPIQPRPQLPAAVRGSLFKNIEWFITTVWIISFLLHAGFLTWLEMTDWPVVSKWEKYMQLQELIAAPDATFEKKKVEETEEGEGDAEKAEKEEEKKEEKKAAKKESVETPAAGPKKSDEEVARERAERRAEIAAQLAERGINKIIGSLAGGGEGGALMDVLGQGDVGADQDALLSQVSGVGVATGESGKLRGPAGGKGSGEAADIEQVRLKGGDAEVKTGGAGTERKIKVQVKRKNAAAIEGTGALDGQEVNRIIGQKMGAIKGCYERALRRDPNLKGKLIVRFTISGSGKVTAARTVQNDLTPEVGDCVSSAFKRFRFPQPDGGSLTMESPFMFLPSN